MKGIKRIAVIGLSAIALIPNSLLAKSFPDLKIGYDWAVPAISRLSDRQIINGFEDGNYYPAKYVSFEETMQLLLGILNPSQGDLNTAKANYSTIAKNYGVNEWAIPAVSYAMSKAIIDEDVLKNAKAGKFFDVEEVRGYPSRADISVYFAKALDIKQYTDMSLLKHKDVEKIPYLAKTYLSGLIKEGIFTSTGSDGYFNPDKGITRAEMAIITDKSYDFKVGAKVTVREESKDLKGFIKNINGNTISINYTNKSTTVNDKIPSIYTTDKTSTFEIAPNGKILGLNEEIKVDNLRVNDLVEFTVNSDGKISLMEVYPQDGNVRAKLIRKFSVPGGDFIGSEYLLRLPDGRERSFYLQINRYGTKDDSNSFVNLKEGEFAVFSTKYKSLFYYNLENKSQDNYGIVKDLYIGWSGIGTLTLQNGMNYRIDSSTIFGRGTETTALFPNPNSRDFIGKTVKIEAEGDLAKRVIMVDQDKTGFFEGNAVVKTDGVLDVGSSILGSEQYRHDIEVTRIDSAFDTAENAKYINRTYTLFSSKKFAKGEKLKVRMTVDQNNIVNCEILGYAQY